MDLPEDVVDQILLKLPVRSLLRFKCISKDWCAMIGSSHFKDTYLAVRRAKPVDDQVVGLKVKEYESDIKKSFVTRWCEDYETLVQSAASAPSSLYDVEITGNPFRSNTLIDHVNGIICVMEAINWKNYSEYMDERRIMSMRESWLNITLVNPALREFRKLPLPDLGEYPDIECIVKTVGFGYDDATNDYKVFLVVSFGMYGIVLGLVYHLSTNSWRILGDMTEFIVFPSGVRLLRTTRQSVFSQGSLHCVMVSSPYYRIIAFNLTTESFQEIDFPDGWSYYDGLRIYYDGSDYDYGDGTVVPDLLTIDKSTLALVALTNSVFNNQETGCEKVLDIWVMKEYGDSESWIKLYSITPLPDLPAPLCVWRRDKLLLLDNRLFCYDLFTGQVNDCGPVYGSNGQHQDEPGQEGYPINGPLAWTLHLVTGHESFVSLKLV